MNFADLAWPPDESAFADLQRRMPVKWGKCRPGEVAMDVAELDFAPSDAMLGGWRGMETAFASGYGPPRGLPTLIDALQRLRASFWPLPTAPLSRRITPGVRVTLRAVVERLAPVIDRAIIAPAPAYDVHTGPLRAAGIPYQIVDPATLDEIGLDSRTVVIINSPHNPTGAVLAADAMGRLRKRVERSGAFVLFNEIYELASVGTSYGPSEIAFGGYERWISVGGFSKGLPLASARLAYLSSSPGLDRTIDTDDFSNLMRPSTPAQLLAEHFVTTGRPWLIGVNAALAENRALLRRADLAKSGLALEVGDAGYTAILHSTVPEPDLADRLARSIGLRTFGASRNEPQGDYVRLAFGTYPGFVREALRRLATLADA